MEPALDSTGPEVADADSLLIRSLLRALPVPVFVLDRQLQIIYANTDWQQFVAGGVVPRHMRVDVCGRAFLDCLPPTERGHWERTVRDVIVNAGLDTAAGQVQEVVCPAAPEPRLVHVVIEPFYLRGADPSGVLLTSHDASRPGRAAAGRPDDGRTDELGLEVARQIAATLNHEINNPLFVVSATLEDLLADSDDPGDQRRLRASLDAVWRVASAVKQLQEIRQLVSTSYIPGFTMLDLEASQAPRKDAQS